MNIVRTGTFQYTHSERYIITCIVLSVGSPEAVYQITYVSADENDYEKDDEIDELDRVDGRRSRSASLDSFDKFCRSGSKSSHDRYNMFNPKHTAELAVEATEGKLMLCFYIHLKQTGRF